jgi:dihydroorotate dehydrogenase
MYRVIIRPILFLFKPEFIHNFIIASLKGFSKVPFATHLIRQAMPKADKSLETELWNIKFPHKIGLAAGLDKDAEAFEMFGALGFSFVEVGTVTPKAQPGNPKPRVFRLPKEHALINRMGFNNKGVDKMAKLLKNRSKKVIVGGNIGKNKLTDNALAVNDYLISFRTLEPLVDYIAINISSPNTPGLRDLQGKEELDHLLSSLDKERKSINSKIPILVKIAPDLSFEQIDDMLSSLQFNNMDGIIATNTTIERSKIINYSTDYISNIGAGGLSGSPLSNRSTEIIRYISKKTNGQVPIVGVGGIMNVQDAIDKIEAGASLIQLYTGFIYEGPSLIHQINSKIKNI